MSTVDKWTPYPHDIEALNPSESCVDSIAADHQEIFLKFWRWNNPSSLWELVTRIDAPHFSDKGSVSILDLASRPLSHEFATIGQDAVLRFWCPSTRQRIGLKMEHGEMPLETWKCRNTVDLKGYINDNTGFLSTASITFSRDGSVLAVCLESVNSKNSGLAILVNVQNCSVHHSRVGVYPGGLCMARFLGCHLVIASNRSVSIWDTVDDIVRTPGPLEQADYPYSGIAYRLLAVDSNTQTFAVTLQHSQSNVASKKGRRCHVQVYDIHSLALLGQQPLREFPLALLPDAQSGDYIIMDAAANIQKFGCSNKSQPSQSLDWAAEVNSGIADLLGTRASGTKYQNTSQGLVTMGKLETPSTQRKELAGIFGDSSFVLPSASILFQDVVQALTS
jgi:NET1-associated nuclear protein 1 (U3 small nucleolar RNA-associated protein 17)